MGMVQLLVMSIRFTSEFLNLVPQEILVTAPELQEDLLGTKVEKVFLSLIQNKELGATRDVTAPELQEVSLYQFIWTSITLTVYSPVSYWTSPYWN